jgi:hypothetical protein
VGVGAIHACYAMLFYPPGRWPAAASLWPLGGQGHQKPLCRSAAFLRRGGGQGYPLRDARLSGRSWPPRDGGYLSPWETAVAPGCSASPCWGRVSIEIDHHCRCLAARAREDRVAHGRPLRDRVTSGHFRSGSPTATLSQGHPRTATLRQGRPRLAIPSQGHPWPLSVRVARGWPFQVRVTPGRPGGALGGGGGRRWLALRAIANPIQNRSRGRRNSVREPLRGGRQHTQVRRVYGEGWLACGSVSGFQPSVVAL